VRSFRHQDQGSPEIEDTGMGRIEKMVLCRAPRLLSQTAETACSSKAYAGTGARKASAFGSRQAAKGIHPKDRGGIEWHHGLTYQSTRTHNSGLRLRRKCWWSGHLYVKAHRDFARIPPLDAASCSRLVIRDRNRPCSSALWSICLALAFTCARALALRGRWRYCSGRMCLESLAREFCPRRVEEAK
jgi:hypothetical protein